MKIVATNVYGGISVGSKAGSLGIISEATHGRYKTAASNEVHVGRIAVDAISIVFVVLNSHGVLGESNQSSRTQVGFKALDLHRIDVPAHPLTSYPPPVK